MFVSIATWLMAEQGTKKAYEVLKKGGTSEEALLKLIKDVEDDERFSSVGLGGLPNRYGIVQLDGAFMDGDSFEFGAVASLENIKSAIDTAYLLKDRSANNFLVGQGAKEFALSRGIKETDVLTSKAYDRYKKKASMLKDDLKAYDGHDTVGAIVLDERGHMVAGTSTSGLFLKENGRVGDSPLIGSGLYVDSSIGGACATGMGEDITKGCLSYEVVRLMESGLSPTEATRSAYKRFEKRYLKTGKKLRDISLIAIDRFGRFGAFSNIDTFTFVVGNNELDAIVYRLAFDENGDQMYSVIDDEFRREWLKNESE